MSEIIRLQVGLCMYKFSKTRFMVYVQVFLQQCSYFIDFRVLFHTTRELSPHQVHRAHVVNKYQSIKHCFVYVNEILEILHCRLVVLDEFFMFFV